MNHSICKVIVSTVLLGLTNASVAQSLTCFFGIPTRYPDFPYNTINTLFTWTDEDDCYQWGYHNFWIYSVDNGYALVDTAHRELDMGPSGSSEWSFNASFNGPGNCHGLGTAAVYEDSEGKPILIDQYYCSVTAYVDPL